MNTEKTAREILSAIGGQENVNSLVHCATRLRFKLKNSSLADKNKTKDIDGVISAVESAGQYQVIIGNRVGEVFKEINKITGGDININESKDADSASSESRESVFAKLIDIISGIFTPFLGALAASGILKGLLLMLAAMDILTKTSGVYTVWWATADSVFYFLPMLIAVTSARKFDANVFVALAIAGALIYPSLLSMVDKNLPLDFFGIPVVLMRYTSTVIPIICAVWLLSVIEHMLNKVIHDSVRNFLTPLICLMVIVPVTLIVLGPLGTYISLGLARGYEYIYNLSPIAAGIITGMGWQYLIIFGLHWAFVPIMYNNLAVNGYDTLKPLFAPSNFAQTGAALGVFLKTKNPKVKQIAGPAVVTGLFGIVEPIIYGISVRYRKPFLWATIGGGIGGAISGYVGAHSLAPGVPGLATLPSFFGPGFGGFIISLIVAFLFTAISTYLLGFNDDMEKELLASDKK